MRTTLTIDPDVLSAVRDLAARNGTTMGQVVSDLVRQTLTNSHEAPKEAETFYGFTPLPRRGVIVTNEMVNAIREDEGI